MYQLLNAMYLLPFLFLELEKLLRTEQDRKAGILFTVLIAIQGCANFYMLYVQTVFCVAYAFIDYIFFYTPFSISHFGKKVWQITKYYLLGILAAGIILVPSIFGFINSSRLAGGIGYLSPLSFTFDELLQRFSDIIIPMIRMTDEQGLAIPFICWIAFVMCCIEERVGKKKIIAFLLLGAYITPLFWSMMNGFSYGTERWFYILYFASSYAAVDLADQHKNIEKRVVNIALIIAVASLIIHYMLYGDKIRVAVYTIGVLGSSYILHKKNISLKRWGFMILIGNIIVNVCFMIAPWKICGHDMWNIFASHDDVNNLVNEKYEVTQEEWYRKDTVENKNSRGYSLIHHYNGTTEYFSILNQNIYAFYNAMSIPRPALHCLEGVDERVVLRAILSIEEAGEYMLPLGFQYKNTISTDDFMELSLLQRQNELLQSIVIEDEKDRKGILDDIDLIDSIPYSITMQNITEEDGILYVSDEPEIHLLLQENFCQEEGELYIFFKNLQCYKYVYNYIQVGGKKLPIGNRQTPFYTGQEDYLIKVEPDDNEIVIKLELDNCYSYDDIEVLWYPYNDMLEKINKLSEHTLVNTVCKADKIEGDIDAIQGYLFMSIPYSDGWHAYVDGEEVPVIKANIGFCAIELSEGNHHIQLHYMPWWFKLGIVCTLSGIVIIAIILFREQKTAFFTNRKNF